MFFRETDNMKDRIKEEARQKLFFEDGNEEREQEELLESEKELIRDFGRVFLILVILAFAGYIVSYLLV